MDFKYCVCKTAAILFLLKMKSSIGNWWKTYLTTFLHDIDCKFHRLLINIAIIMSKWYENHGKYQSWLYKSLLMNIQSTCQNYIKIVVNINNDCTNFKLILLTMCKKGSSSPIRNVVIISTLLMLGTEYSGLFDQYHACWCPGSLSCQGINRYGFDSIGYRQHVGLLHCESSLLLLNKIQDMTWNVNTSFLIFKTIQHIKI